jgi:hypothetical protein
MAILPAACGHNFQSIYLQATLSEANMLRQEAKQLSAGAATILELLRHWDSLPPDMSWLLVRPIVRLLLWLLPEHLPSVSEPGRAAELRPPAMSATATDQCKLSHGAASGGSWKHSFGAAFTADVATVSAAMSHGVSSADSCSMTLLQDCTKLSSRGD